MLRIVVINSRTSCCTCADIATAVALAPVDHVDCHVDLGCDFIGAAWRLQVVQDTPTNIVIVTMRAVMLMHVQLHGSV